jgi:general secretion pathway protein N
MPARSKVRIPTMRRSNLMSRPLFKWTLLALAIYLAFLVINLPAGMLFAQLSKRGVQASAISGTLWHGQATNVQVGVLRLGNADWQLRFLPLFTGKLAADVKLTPAKGFAQGRVSVSLAGALSFTDLAASLPLESIVGQDGLPGGWVGTAQAKLDELVFKDNWPAVAKGTIDILDLTGPTNQPNNIGAYRLNFSGESNSAGKNNELIGTLQDMPGAAIGVSGTLKLSTGHSYELDTLIASRPNTPTSIAQDMQILGTPDAQGRRPFSVSGTM